MLPRLSKLLFAFFNCITGTCIFSTFLNVFLRVRRWKEGHVHEVDTLRQLWERVIVVFVTLVTNATGVVPSMAQKLNYFVNMLWCQEMISILACYDITTPWKHTLCNCAIAICKKEKKCKTSLTFGINLNLIGPVFHLELIKNQPLPAQLPTTQHW